MTRHFYTISPSGMSCKFCGKAFNGGFNLRRHEKECCPLMGELGREISGTECQTADPQHDTSTVTTHGSESPMTGDNGTETEKKRKYKTAFQEMKINLADSNILPKLQKKLESIHLQRSMMILRKFLIKRRLKDYSFTDDSDDIYEDPLTT